MSCPPGLVCVEHEGAVLEFAPACRPVGAFIVRENLARTIDLTGVTESYGVFGVALADRGFGDVGCLEWEGAND